MKIEEAKKLKAELEMKICDLMNEFTTKTGIELEGIRMLQLKEAETRRGITMEDIEKKLKEKGMSSEEIESIKKGNEEKEEGITEIIDLTGDMTDAEFELIVDRTYERIMSNMHEIGKEEVRKTLEYYRIDLLTLQTMDIKFKFGYNTGYFSQMLERIRRKE